MSYNHNLFDPFSTIDSIFNNAISVLDAFEDMPRNPIPNKVNNSICSSTFPAADLYAEEDGYHINVAVAGYTEEDIFPEYKEDYLHLTFKKPKTDESKKRIWVQQRIKLPEEAKLALFIDTRKYDVSKISISIENGILSVLVPPSSNYVGSYAIGINGKSPKSLVDKTAEEEKPEEE